MTPYYDDGQIQVWHADCRDILPTIDPATVALVLTDPPYGIDHGQSSGINRFTVREGLHDKRHLHVPIAGDEEPFDPAHILSLNKPTILFGANVFSDRLPCGSWIIWDKRTPNGAKNVMADGEAAWFSKGHGVYIFSHTWDGFNRASERQTRLHPTQKPVALFRWILDRWSKPGDLILDPYMGSGPVARACLDLGRRYIGIELSEAYCEIAVSRLSQQVLPLDVA